MDNEDDFQVVHLLQLMLVEQQGEDELLLACVLGWCAMDFKFTTFSISYSLRVRPKTFSESLNHARTVHSRHLMLSASYRKIMMKEKEGRQSRIPTRRYFSVDAVASEIPH